MRLAILLTFVVASTQCYKVILNNDQYTDLPIKYNRNGVENTMVLPAKTSSGPSTWTVMSKLGVNANVTIAMLNLFVDIRPTNPQGNPPTLDVTGGYLSFGTTETTVYMNVLTPTDGAIITCNLQGLGIPHLCIKSPGTGGTIAEPSKTLTIEYADAGQYNIWFKNE